MLLALLRSDDRVAAGRPPTGFGASGRRYRGGVRLFACLGRRCTYHPRKADM